MTHERLLLEVAELEARELKASLREMMALVRQYTFTIAIAPEEMHSYVKAGRLVGEITVEEVTRVSK